jgi:hypothetical protein
MIDLLCIAVTKNEADLLHTVLEHAADTTVGCSELSRQHEAILDLKQRVTDAGRK